MAKVKINDHEIEVFKDATILEAAAELDGVYIPTLCHMNLESFNVEHRIGSCRICMVEVVENTRKRLAPACCTPVTEGMVIRTNTPEVIQARRIILGLLLSDHPFDCLNCPKNLECELQALAKRFGIDHLTYTGEVSTYKKDISSKAIKRDLDKCILCRRCETACNDIQTVGTLTGYGRGFNAVVAPAEMKPLSETNCVMCGQCVNVCPTAALTEISYTKKVWSALSDSSKKVIVQVAPAVRVAMSEEPGLNMTGKLVAGLKQLGFEAVFDTNFGADLTIVEESREIIERLTSRDNLPILTSCCPGWVNFLEFQFPDLIKIPSTCKSPQQMFGAIAKTYYADKIGVKPADLIVVSVMPCLAKKHEAGRAEFSRDGVRDVDYVITTRELIRMFNEAGIRLDKLPEERFDNPLGESTGAASIFGVSGGVLEAALRTAYEKLTGKELDSINFTRVRGLDGIKEAEFNVNGRIIRVAAASGLGNARSLLEKIRSGVSRYDIIEIMACPGGCINGGGQPYIHSDTSILEKRMKALYSIDSSKEIRKSHENPYIMKLYHDSLGEPGGEKAHSLLHTNYYKKK